MLPRHPLAGALHVAALLSLTLVGCRAGSPKPDATAGAARDATFRSQRFHYDWRLPATWEFVQPATLGFTDQPSIELAAARSRNVQRPTSLALLVTDFVSVIPGKVPGPEALDTLEEYAVEQMQQLGITVTDRRRFDFFAEKAVRVDGTVDSTKRYVAMTLFTHGRRRFELRCYSDAFQTGIPCQDALGGFVVHDTKELIKPSDQPHVLHLRDTRFGLTFDAPDDSWMAIGPREGMGGSQAVWIWVNNGRQIDVSGLELPRQVDLLEETAARKMASSFRKPGINVEVKPAALSGRACWRIEITPEHGDQQDMFVQIRGKMMYGLLVTAPTRDEELIARALAGLRITTD